MKGHDLTLVFDKMTLVAVLRIVRTLLLSPGCKIVVAWTGWSALKLRGSSEAW